MLYILSSNVSFASDEFFFNPKFLSDDISSVADLSIFENGVEVPEGTYRVDLYVNDIYVSSQDIRFKLNKEKNSIYPCFTGNTILKMGVNISSISGFADLKENKCFSLKDIITDSTVDFNYSSQRLNVTIPKIFMDNKARGYIPPELWDSGINASLLNYSITGSNTRTIEGKDSQYLHANLQAGFNFNEWRFRSNTFFNYESISNTKKWEYQNAYFDRGLNNLRSRVVIGDSSTLDSIFNNFNFRGAAIISDEEMLPESQKGFAPIIRGIAKGTAQVSIKQNNYEIYRSTVPPGPFIIDDISGISASNELEVTVTEVDGTSQVFKVPFATSPLLQREGYTKYAIITGSFRSTNKQYQSSPGFVQATAFHGLSNNFTLYGGSQLAENYQSLNVGASLNLGFLGGVSTDITNAYSKLYDGSNYQGQSYRLLYNKVLNDIGTNLNLVAYRYSTNGYYDFEDTTYKNIPKNLLSNESFYEYYNLHNKKLTQFQIGVNQKINNSSSFYFNLYNITYRNKVAPERQIQVGYNKYYNGLNLGLNYNYVKNNLNVGSDQTLSLSLNMPMDSWYRKSTPFKSSNINYSSSNDFYGNMNNTLGFYGTLLEDRNLNYSVQTTYNEDRKNAGNASLNYKGAYANTNIGFSYTEGSTKQLYFGASGGILTHQNGLTFSQPFYNSVILVKAPKAKDAKFDNYPGIKTNSKGYAVLPYATNYRENRVAINTNSLAENVELDETILSVIPTRGAVARAEFFPKIGFKALMRLSRNGKPIPFGAIVSASEKNSSIVSDDGQVYLTGLSEQGELNIKWGDTPDKQCIAKYSLKDIHHELRVDGYVAECNE